MRQCPECKLFSPDEAPRCDCGFSFAPEQTGELGHLAEHVKHGASWFYWVGGLSIVSSVLAVLGIDFFFFIGLAITAYSRAVLAGLLGIPVPNVGFEPSLIPVTVVEVLIGLSFMAAGRAARNGLKIAFLVGISIYAVDALLCLVDAQLPIFGFHLLALLFMIRGHRALRTLYKRYQEIADVPFQGRQTWFQYGLAFSPLILVTPILMIFVLGWALTLFFGGGLMGPMEAAILQRAPGVLSDQEQERLHVAFSRVSDRFAEEGGIPVEDAARMNGAAEKIVSMPDGQKPTREELLDFVRILEEIGGSGPGQPPSTDILSTDISTDEFLISQPGGWSIESSGESVDASEVVLRLNETTRIRLEVDSREEDPDMRLDFSFQSFAASFQVEDCRDDWQILEWGGYRGQGRAFRCSRAGTPVRAKFFAAEVEEGKYLEICQLFDPVDESEVLLADHLIRETLRIR